MDDSRAIFTLLNDIGITCKAKTLVFCTSLYLQLYYTVYYNFEMVSPCLNRILCNSKSTVTIMLPKL